jgi:peptidoglycan hydrolase-like protein with peptidoglycan-binding domain
MATMYRAVLYQKGDRGQEVALLQQYLTRAGYDTKGIDGVFGANTEAAVKAIQNATGLTADGLVWPETFEAIANAKPIRSTPAAPPVVPVREESVAKIEPAGAHPLLGAKVPPWLVPAGVGAVALAALLIFMPSNKSPALAGHSRRKSRR